MREGQINPEILVIGGGVIGLAIARQLHKNGGGRIAVVDQGVCGREASWAAAGMLGPQVEASELGSFFEFCAEARDLYPRLADELFDETGIDIELDRTGTLSLAFNDAEAGELMQRYDRQREAGLAVERLSREETLKLEPQLSGDVVMGLLFANDWQVENRILVEALRRYAQLNGIALVENTSVDNLLIVNELVTGADTRAGRIYAQQVVLATGAWTSFIKLGDAPLPFEVEPVRGQIVVYEPADRAFKHVVHSPRGYVVPRRDRRVLVGSTTERVGFDKTVTENAADALRAAACEISPPFKGMPIADHWSGLRPFCGDGSPVIGAIEGFDGSFVASGHYRNGILLAPLTAKLAAEKLIDGTRSEYLDIYSPQRFAERSIGTGN